MLWHSLVVKALPSFMIAGAPPPGSTSSSKVASEVDTVIQGMGPRLGGGRIVAAAPFHTVRAAGPVGARSWLESYQSVHTFLDV